MPRPPHPIVCRKKAKILTFCLFLAGLALVSYSGVWWPGILLAVGFPLALRQYLSGRSYDAIVSLFVFLGGFTSVSFDIEWQIILPVLFTVGGIYLLCRDLFESSCLPEEEKEEDLNEEIEEESHKQ